MGPFGIERYGQVSEDELGLFARGPYFPRHWR
jgi:hypothetical protein